MERCQAGVQLGTRRSGAHQGVDFSDHASCETTHYFAAIGRPHIRLKQLEFWSPLGLTNGFEQLAEHPFYLTSYSVFV